VTARRFIVEDGRSWPSTAGHAERFAGCSERDCPGEEWSFAIECAHADDLAGAMLREVCAYTLLLVLDPLEGVTVTVTDYPDGYELDGLDRVRPETVAPGLRAAMVAEDPAHADCWRPLLEDVLELVGDAAGWDQQRLQSERVCLALTR
jgi:hypothetical protein